MESSKTDPADRPPLPPPRTASAASQSAINSPARNIAATPIPAKSSSPKTNDSPPPPRLPSKSPPPLDSSIEDIEVDDLAALEEDLLDDDDLLAVPHAKHFLDYDSQPPPEFDATVIGPNKTSQQPAPSAVLPSVAANNPNTSSSYDEDDDDVDVSSTVAVKGMPSGFYPGEVRKVDKKYETDGEISDFELANYSHSMRARRAEKAQNSEDGLLHSGGVRPKKHFLDENPIPPEEFEREHRSLDRKYERAKELDPTKSSERKSSIKSASGRRKDTPSFALRRFLEPDSVGPSSLPQPLVHRGTWPADRPNDTHIGHMSGGVSMPGNQALDPSNSDDEPSGSRKQMGPKVECVYSLLSMLGCSSDQVKMSRKFLELSRSPDTCAVLRHSRCIPLIVQIIHSDADEQTRKDASTALHNVVNCHPDDKAGRREAKVLRHIETVLEYSESLKQMLCDGEALADDRDRHPLQAMSSLMKISFDGEHRRAMCQLGALQAIASVVQYDHAMHGNVAMDERCVSLRRYSAMALTNLTFGDGDNKAALCANKEFMRAFVAQLNSNVDDLLPVTANVLRNLSWRADNTMKCVLNEIGTVTALTKAVMRNQNESTIKALLSALWNLSAHCSPNKAEFCTVDGALAFLVDMLTYEGPSKSLTIIENAGGILRNVSSHIAVNESYRAILRQRNCLGILLQQLSSESLTIVSNACGTLWNLSARCAQDQQFLIDNNAVRRLSLLLPSKHKMISNGSSAALKNLMNFQPSAVTHGLLDPVASAMRLKKLPTLNVRKQRAFERDLDQNLGETCENIEITTPPKETHKSMDEFLQLNNHNRQQPKSLVSVMPRSESKDSVASVVCIGNSKSNSNANLPSTPRRSVTTKTNEEPSTSNADHPVSSGPYQETDLDQITDFSLRYGELPNGDYSDPDETTINKPSTSKPPTENTLIPDDSVKCYETEGTPYVISNAASVTDLSRGIKAMAMAEPTKKSFIKSDRLGAIENSGINTPDRCTNYCEEGTPGVYDSYSSLDEADDRNEEAEVQPTSAKPMIIEENIVEEQPVTYQHPEEDDEEDEERDHVAESLIESECGTNAPTTPGGTTVGQKPITFETPMMFSRHSSMESLSSIEPALVMDDRSSVVSDFSRLASGVISPSEIPDSPSQMIAHSPRRSSTGAAAASAALSFFPATPPTQQQYLPTTTAQQPLRSVFEDDVNAFGVENTPAQFSCATSLSNLSLDDEPKIASDSLSKEAKVTEEDEEEKEKETKEEDESQNKRTEIECSRITEETSEESDEDGDADKDLLATCINIGMNKTQAVTEAGKPELVKPDLVKTDLVKPDEAKPDLVLQNQALNNPNDESTSGSDAADESILEQCIRDGIQRVTIKPPQRQSNTPPIPGPKPVKLSQQLPQPQQQQHHDDSLSSLSMDEEDGAILQKAIAAGSNKMLKTSVPPSKPASNYLQQNAIAAEDSYSSIDSIDSGDTQNANSILEHCIATGMNKRGAVHTMPAPPPPPAVTTTTIAQSSAIKSRVPERILSSSPKRSQLPQLFKSPSQLERERQRERDRKDEALLNECILTGMSKSRSISVPQNQPQPHTSNFRRDQLLSAHQAAAAAAHHHDASHSNHHFSQPQLQNPMGVPKNVQTTSVAAAADSSLNVRCTVSGVEETIHYQPHHYHNNNNNNNNTNTINMHTITNQLPSNITSPNPTNNIIHQQVEDRNVSKSDLSYLTVNHPAAPDHRTTTRNGSSSSSGTTTTNNILLLDQSLASISDFSQAPLDHSNEYPAMAISNESDAAATDAKLILDTASSSSVMDQSNEFLMDEQYNNESDSNEFAAEEEEEDLSDAEFAAEVERELRGNTEEQTRSTSMVADKHKDPDLMMQSVERLTQELMSTAEMLRTASTTEDVEPTVYERKSSSTNTWNEDTCPNEVSFPSISWTAPVIAADDDDDDATISKENPSRPVIDTRSFILGQSHGELEHDDFIQGTSQPESLEADTTTLTPGVVVGGDGQSESSSSGIRFHVGGPTFRDHHRLHNHRSTTNVSSASSAFHLASASAAGRSFTCAEPISSTSDMTNSTIIAMEASKLATELFNMQTMTDSSHSLDLDDIRPPSGMDMISGYFEPSISSTVGPMFSPQLARRKKSLPVGLVAKRALNQYTNNGGGSSSAAGSIESVHSSCNLDNVKPPSMMDDLMDSMISVASITSEVASPNHTHYDTAMSQILDHDDEDDEDTTTLRSCYDLPQDSEQATPVASDYSSAESTPRKQRCVRRALTSKQKRQAAKERYRTYTIAADMVLMDSDAQSDDTNEAAAAAATAAATTYNKKDEDMYTQPEKGATTAAAGSLEPDEEVVSTNMVQIEIVEGRTRPISSTTSPNIATSTSRQRRTEQNRSRFQTQIIDPLHFADLNYSGNSAATPPRPRLQTFSSQEDDNEDVYRLGNQKFQSAVIDTTSSGSNSLDDDADMSSIRALTERFRFITEAVPTPSTPTTTLPTVARKLAILTQQRINTTEQQPPSTVPQQHHHQPHSLDFEQNSETESCDEHCIDDETYNIPEAPKIVAKPKIVKPSFAAEQQQQQLFEVESNEPEAKAIRGKKKAAYVSPYRKSVNTSPMIRKAAATTTTSTTPSPAKRNISKLMTPRSSQSNIVTKTHVLTNKSSLTTKQPAIAKTGLVKPGFSSNTTTNAKTSVDKSKNFKSSNKSIDSIPSSPKKVVANGRLSTTPTSVVTKTNGKMAPPPTMPERQGTFVKDEPTHADVPIVTSAPSSPAKTSRLPSKLPSVSTTTTATPPPVKSTATSISRLKTPLQRSVSSGNAAKITPPKSLTRPATNQPAQSRSPSTPSIPMRSYSNASLKSTKTTPTSSQPPSRSNSNLSKNGVISTAGITSRIAGLWKKPDAVKMAASKPAASQNGKPPPVGRLIRSSTFDNTPEEDRNQVDMTEVQNPIVMMRVKQPPASRVDSTTSTNVNTTAPKRISRLGTFINMEETVT